MLKSLDATLPVTTVDVVIVGAGFAGLSAAERLADAADEVLVLSTPAEFIAVGQGYSDFSQLSDEDAVEALRSVNAPT
jgi:predicted phosphoribosyltransferase